MGNSRIGEGTPFRLGRDQRCCLCSPSLLCVSQRPEWHNRSLLVVLLAPPCDALPSPVMHLVAPWCMTVARRISLRPPDHLGLPEPFTADPPPLVSGNSFSFQINDVSHAERYSTRSLRVTNVRRDAALRERRLPKSPDPAQKHPARPAL